MGVLGRVVLRRWETKYLRKFVHCIWLVLGGRERSDEWMAHFKKSDKGLEVR